MRFAHPYQFAVVFAATLSVSGCGEKPQPSAEPGKEQAAPQPGTPQPTNPGPKDDTEELLKATPEASITETELAAEIKKDIALQKYNGKVIDVTGKLKHYDYTIAWGGLPDVMLDSFNYKYTLRDPNALARVAPGQTVTLRARCNSLTGFDKSVIVKVEGDPPQEIVADKLAAEYAADKEGTEKKYKGKYVVLKGRARTVKEGSFVDIALSSPGVKPEIVCHFHDHWASHAKKHGWLKEGAEVQILCQTILGEPSFIDAVVRGPLK